MRKTDKERFWEKVNKTDSCWLWTASKIKTGYGYFGFQKKVWRAHRVSWTFANGNIPAGLHILHTCHVRSCVRPEHLKLGTHQDNMKDKKQARRDLNCKKTHCPQGHLYSGENLYVAPDGRRSCRTCKRNNMRSYRALKKREMAA